MKVYREGREIFEIKDYRQVGSFMNVATIEATVKTPTPFAFKVGDYVIFDYNGLTYTLYNVAPEKKQARSGTYGEAFIYELKFKADTEQLVICPFLDLVANDNGLHYTSLPSFSTYENVYGIAVRLQANMDYLYPNQWRFDVVNTTDSALLELLNEPREFAISGESCFDGLKKIYDTWGVSFIHTFENGINIITIGKSAGTTSVFRYGKGQGLRTIKKNIQNIDQLCTRAYVYGSTRNIPALWYNDRGYIGEAQYAPNLMIPPSKWVGGVPQGAYIDAVFDGENRIEKYGLRIKTLSYDGSDNSKDEIYPSIEKVTAYDIRKAKEELEQTTYIPNAELYADNERMDFVLVGSNVEDDGIGTDSDYTLYSDKIYSNIKGEVLDFKVAELLPDNSYKTINLQKSITLCSFDVTKPAIYRLSEVVNLATFFKTESECTVSATITVQKPSGEYIKLNQFSLSEKHRGYMQLPEVGNIRANETGRYSIVLNVNVSWSLDIVLPSHYEGISMTCTIKEATVTLSRGQNIMSDFFEVKIKQIGFNINDVTASGVYKSIHIKNGMCGGRSFNITQCKYSEADDSWVLTCKRIDDNSISQRFPNKIFQIASGDQFVLLNIHMPDIYVHTAMQRLYNTAIEDLRHLSKPQYVIEPEIDNIQMARSPQIIKEGMYMPIEDTDISYIDDTLIDSVTITNKGNELRTFQVTLRSDKIINTFTKLASRISSLESSLADAESKSNISQAQSEDNSMVNTGGSTDIDLSAYATIDYVDTAIQDAKDTRVDALINTTIPALESDIAKRALQTALDTHISNYNSFAASTSTTLTAHDKRIKSFEDIIGIDENGDVYIKKNGDVARNFYSYGEISSGGLSDTESGDGSVVTVEQILTEGTPIANVIVNGVDNIIYAPENSGGVSGGTIEGNLTIKNDGWGNQLSIVETNGTSDSIIRFYTLGTGSDNFLGALGFNTTKQPIINVPNVGSYEILHSGNTTPLVSSYNGICPVPSSGGIGEDGFAPILTTALSSMKSYMGSVYSGSTWWNILSIRHRNGADDGSNYGMYFKAYMTHWGDLVWNKQVAGNWGKERIIIDSENIGSYIAGGGTAGMPLNPVYVQFKNEDDSLGGWVGQGSGGNNNMIVYTDANSEFKLYTGGVQRLLVNSGGAGVYEGYSLMITHTRYWGNDAGQQRNPTLGHLNDGTIGFTMQGYNYGLFTWTNWSSGDSNLQVGRADGHAYAYNMRLQPLGGNVIIGNPDYDDSGDRLQVYGSHIYTTGLHSPTGGYIWWNDKGLHLNPNNGSETPNAVNILNNGHVLIGDTTDRGNKVAIQAINSPGSINSTNLNNTGLSLGMIDQGYGMNFWTEGSGKGYIQQGRTDGTGVLYELVLQPFGGRVSTIASHNTVINSNTYGLIIGGRYSAMNYNSGIAFCGLHNYQGSDTYANHAHAWIGLGPYLNLTGPEVYPFVIATNSSTTTGAAPDVRLMINPLTGVTTVYGNFVATGEVTSGSDERYKRIESYAEIDVETIANAPIINFKWTDREDEKVHLGSTAQYWYNTSLSNGVIPTDDEKLWTMGYGQIALAGLVSVAKKVVNHEERIKVLEEENKQLKQQLNEYRRA